MYIKLNKLAEYILEIKTLDFMAVVRSYCTLEPSHKVASSKYESDFIRVRVKIIYKMNKKADLPFLQA